MNPHASRHEKLGALHVKSIYWDNTKIIYSKKIKTEL